MSGDVSGLRVGLMEEGFDEAEADVTQTVKAAAESLKQLGVTVDEFSFPQLTDCQSPCVTDLVSYHFIIVIITITRLSQAER